MMTLLKPRLVFGTAGSTTKRGVARDLLHFLPRHPSIRGQDRVLGQDRFYGSLLC
jgi:hypothetical protein